MKPKNRESKSFLIVIALAAAFLLPSCAEMEHSNTKSLLATAGFRVRTPATATQKEVYAALTPNQVQRATASGKVFYVYKDDAAGVAYVGHEAEYQNYKRLAIEQHIAQERYMVYEMDRRAASRWYGGWGPHGMWW